jgi:ATP-dependent Clp protease ATP-binding subunit ClpA
MTTTTLSSLWRSTLNILTQQRKHHDRMTSQVKEEAFEIETFPSTTKVPLFQLEQYLNHHLENQKIANKLLAYTMIRYHSIWGDRKRPLSFLLIGPLSTGRIYASKLLAKSQALPFVYFDMSFFGEDKMSVFKQFVNFEDKKRNQQAGQLNRVLSKAPNAVIVLNHIDRASKQILDVLHILLTQGAIKSSAAAENVLDIRYATIICMVDMTDHKSEVIQHFYDIKNVHTNVEKAMSEHPSIVKSKSKYTVDVNSSLFPLSAVQKSESKAEETDEIDTILKRYDPIHVLSEMTQYREKIYPYLLSLFNHPAVKCPDSLLDAFTAIIPYFEFSNVELVTKILHVLRQFKQIASDRKNIRLTWSEDVVIWLMKQFVDNFSNGRYTSVQRLIEVHILTRLAIIDQTIESGDHVHLNVIVPEVDREGKDLEHERISIQVLNKRFDNTLRKKVAHIQSNL